MAKIISIHSFRGGTGKSNIAANIASVLAAEGVRVGVVDTDIQSPGIHVLFGLKGTTFNYALNDYLWGKCNIEQTAHDVTPEVGGAMKGRIFLIPCSMRISEIANILRKGYDINLLTTGFSQLLKELALDVLILDTHPGLNEETLFSLAISHVLAIILRPDHQDYEGTGVTVAVARSLNVPEMMLIVNKLPPDLDAAKVQAEVEQAYDCDVAAVLPHSFEMMNVASAGLFVLQNPDHPLTALYKQIATKMVG